MLHAQDHRNGENPMWTVCLDRPHVTRLSLCSLYCFLRLPWKLALQEFSTPIDYTFSAKA